MRAKSSGPKRKRKVPDRRSEILTAAAKVFSEKGYQRTTTRDIAEAAQVSEGTIYNYFKSKDELLIALMMDLKDGLQLESKLDRGSTAGSRSLVLDLLNDRQNFVSENYGTLKAVLAEILVNPELNERYYRELVEPVFKHLETHLKAHSDRGQIEVEDTAIATRIILGTIMGLFLLHTLGDPVVRENWEKMPDQVVDLLFDGLEVDSHPQEKGVRSGTSPSG